jgi:hypothetical protein
VSVNPGLHALHFEGPGGAKLDRQFVVREGEKHQSIAVVLGAPAPVASAAPPGGQSPPSTSPKAAAGEGGHSAPWKTVGWVAGGVGVAGLALGAVFGAVTLSDKGSDCNPHGVCNPGTLGGIKGAATASDIGWIAGGVLLAGGAALVLFAPSESPKAAVRVAPSVTASGVGAVIGGSW